MSASQKYINSSTPMNLEKLSVVRIGFTVWTCGYWKKSTVLMHLPLYCRRSSKSNQAVMSRCGCCGSTITGAILFLFSVATRKLHAIPGTEKRRTHLVFDMETGHKTKSVWQLLSYSIKKLDCYWIQHSRTYTIATKHECCESTFHCKYFEVSLAASIIVKWILPQKQKHNNHCLFGGRFD